MGCVLNKVGLNWLGLPISTSLVKALVTSISSCLHLQRCLLLLSCLPPPTFFFLFVPLSSCIFINFFTYRFLKRLSRTEQTSKMWCSIFHEFFIAFRLIHFQKLVSFAVLLNLHVIDFSRCQHNIWCSESVMFTSAPSIHLKSVRKSLYFVFEISLKSSN